MLNTLKIFDELKETMDEPSAKKLAEVFGLIYDDLQNIVTKTDFNDLKEIVKDLAGAQQRTEVRLENLSRYKRRLRRSYKPL